jgi:thiamine biosynthesis protein ThiS
MQINGKPFDYSPGLTLHALLEQLEVKREGIAVAVNDDIYAGTRAPDVELKEDDTIDIVRIAAGG